MFAPVPSEKSKDIHHELGQDAIGRTMQEQLSRYEVHEGKPFLGTKFSDSMVKAGLARYVKCSLFFLRDLRAFVVKRSLE